MRKRSKHKTLKVNGVMVDAVTLAGLAEITGKSKKTLVRYEQTEIMPQAPLMFRGVRYYPVTLAQKLKPLFDTIGGGHKTPAETTIEINKLFKEEVDKLCQQKP